MRGESKSVVGERLRSFRDRHGWSLRTLSERCGLSINAISRIERGENSPTITSLTKLADALSIPITDFFLERNANSALLIKKGAGQKIDGNGHTVEPLGKGYASKQLEPFLVKLEPHCKPHVDKIGHPGEEFVYCVSGEVEYCIEDQVFRLKQGDSLLFQASKPHSYLNPSDRIAQLLLVFQAAQDNRLAREIHLGD